MARESRKLSQRELAMGFVVLAISCYGYKAYWYSGQQKALEDWNRKTNLLQVEIDKNQAMVDGLQKRVAASVQEIEKASPLKSYLVTSSRLAQVIRSLVSEDTHLVTKLIQVESVDEAKGHKEVVLKLEIEGSFPAIGAFVERIESSQLLAEVAAIDIIRVANDLEKCIAKIKLHTRLFTEGDNG